MIECKNQCILGKFKGCCACCPEKDGCNERCSHDPTDCGCATFEGESGLELFKSEQLTVLQNIADLCTAKKQIEAKEKELKDQLKQAMEQYGVTKFESDILNITYVAESSSTQLDSAKVKKLHPDIVSKCSKTVKKSAYIKVTVKDGDE